ncbi:MAG TPA: sulfotransferase [Bryobacteraceae bacterium]|nr:sulfotransferase [Bryobacteraceae bacterium]
MSALRSERPVLILGSGRCGSTLLQSILNTNPDFVIWGEHNGFLRQIAAAYYDARHERFPDHSGLDAPARIRELRAPRHWPAWDNLTGEAEFIERFREFIRSFFADPAGKATRWGFKEIRYGRGSKDQTLKLMLECFPETRIIILIRSPEATIFSILSHWTFAAERQGKIDLQDLDAQILAAAHSWNVQYMHLHNLAQAPGKCLKLRYEDLTDAGSYGRLSQFLDTSPFQYKTALARVKDASKKTDPTAVLIRRRLRALQAEIEAATSSARAAYGYDGPAPLRQVKTAK